MWGNLVRITKAEDITGPGEDGYSLRLEFTVEPIEAPGDLPRSGKKEEARLDVRMSDSRAATWGLGRSRVENRGKAVLLMKLLGVLHIKSVLGGRDVSKKEELPVNTKTFPGECPVVIGTMEEPDLSFEAERPKKPIGFS